MGWLHRRFTLWRYRRSLGPALVARYGRERSYTVAQVRATLEHLGLGTTYLAHAAAGYCDRHDFERAIAGDWKVLRREMRPRFPGRGGSSGPWTQDRDIVMDVLATQQYRD